MCEMFLQPYDLWETNRHASHSSVHLDGVSTCSVTSSHDRHSLPKAMDKVLRWYSAEMDTEDRCGETGEDGPQNRT